MRPALIACSHGTASPQGQVAVARLVSAVAARLPEVDVREAFVDVNGPPVSQVLQELGTSPARVVPLLLSAGYHVYVDLAQAVARTPTATLAGALGPDPRLAQILADRLRDVGVRDDDAVLLAAAGSSDERAAADCRQVAEHLGQLIGRPSPAAYLSAAEPRLEAAVAAARREGARVVVATYLLAPGHFADLAAGCGADAVTGPLLVPGGPPPESLIDVVVDRYAG